jgi:hypothetical protein
VLIPFGHSPDFDLAAYVNDRSLRIQVKASTQRVVTPNGHGRSAVSLATSGGTRAGTGSGNGSIPGVSITSSC